MPDVDDYEYLIQTHDEWDQVIFDHGKCRIEAYEDDLEESYQEYEDQWISDRLEHLLDVWQSLIDVLAYNNVGHNMNFGHFTNYIDNVSKDEQYNWEIKKSELNKNYSDSKLTSYEWSTKYYKELENCAGYIISEGYNVGSFESFGNFVWTYSV